MLMHLHHTSFCTQGNVAEANAQFSYHQWVIQIIQDHVLNHAS